MYIENRRNIRCIHKHMQNMADKCLHLASIIGDRLVICKLFRGERNKELRNRVPDRRDEERRTHYERSKEFLQGVRQGLR